MTKQRRASNIENLGDEKLEQSLSDWYSRGDAHGPDSEHLERAGEWGGSVHYVHARRTKEGLIRVYIDFGSIKNVEHAEAELDKIIAGCGYEIIRGDILASDGTKFEIRKVART